MFWVLFGPLPHRQAQQAPRLFRTVKAHPFRRSSSQLLQVRQVTRLPPTSRQAQTRKWTKAAVLVEPEPRRAKTRTRTCSSGQPSRLKTTTRRPSTRSCLSSCRRRAPRRPSCSIRRQAVAVTLRRIFSSKRDEAAHPHRHQVQAQLRERSSHPARPSQPWHNSTSKPTTTVLSTVQHGTAATRPSATRPRSPRQTAAVIPPRHRQPSSRTVATRAAACFRTTTRTRSRVTN